mgnify:CR=1 FL=1
MVHYYFVFSQRFPLAIHENHIFLQQWDAVRFAVCGITNIHFGDLKINIPCDTYHIYIA